MHGAAVLPGDPSLTHTLARPRGCRGCRGGSDVVRKRRRNACACRAPRRHAARAHRREAPAPGSCGVRRRGVLRGERPRQRALQRAATAATRRPAGARGGRGVHAGATPRRGRHACVRGGAHRLRSGRCLCSGWAPAQLRTCALALSVHAWHTVSTVSSYAGVYDVHAPL